MKKSNNILFVIAVLLSAFLLYLWYHLGFNEVDSPTDLVVSCVWWVAIVGMIVGIVKTEKTRKEKVRTSYVGSGFLFNSEAGRVALEGRSAVDALEQTLAGLKYDFTNSEVDEATKAAIKMVVRTKTYEAATEEGAEPSWTGEVVAAVPGSPAVPFANKAELAALLAAF